MERNNNIILGSRDYAVKFPEIKSVVSYIQNQYMSSVTDNKLLYHYTDINGFMGIMGNKELWATNTYFLNDKMECKQALEDSLKVIDSLMKKNYMSNSIFPIYLWNAIEDMLKSQMYSSIYSISFCRYGDLLSQWRGYGQKGGVSLGFDLSGYQVEHDGKTDTVPFVIMDRGHCESIDIEKCDFNHDYGERGINLYSVHYDTDEHEKILEDIISIGYDHMKEEGIPRTSVEQYFNNLVQTILEAIQYVTPIIKNKGFEEEKEVRYIWRNDGTRKICFREKKGIIVPYIRCVIRDCNCGELKFFPVKDIIVGPQVNQKEVEDSIKFFLQNNGYEYLVDKVRASKIPYRE